MATVTLFKDKFEDTDAGREQVAAQWAGKAG